MAGRRGGTGTVGTPTPPLARAAPGLSPPSHPGGKAPQRAI